MEEARPQKRILLTFFKQEKLVIFILHSLSTSLVCAKAIESVVAC